MNKQKTVLYLIACGCALFVLFNLRSDKRRLEDYEHRYEQQDERRRRLNWEQGIIDLEDDIQPEDLDEQEDLEFSYGDILIINSEHVINSIPQQRQDIRSFIERLLHDEDVQPNEFDLARVRFTVQEQDERMLLQSYIDLNQPTNLIDLLPIWAQCFQDRAETGDYPELYNQADRDFARHLRNIQNRIERRQAVFAAINR